MLSSADPVRVFQEFATLDLVSGGRAEIIAGRGSFTESFPLFGYDLEDYDDLFAEKLGLLLALRRPEPVTWSGRFRAPLSDVVVQPRPEQSPLPVWIGVGGNPGSVVRAGVLGLPVALAIIGGSPARFAPLADLHRRALAQAGHDPADAPFAVHAHGFVAPTAEQAGRDYYPSYAGAMTALGRERGWSPMTREAFDVLSSPAGSLVIGPPSRSPRRSCSCGGSSASSASCCTSASALSRTRRSCAPSSCSAPRSLHWCSGSSPRPSRGAAGDCPRRPTRREGWEAGAPRSGRLRSPLAG